MFVRYLPIDLVTTLHAYDELITAIHVRMPSDITPASTESQMSVPASVLSTDHFTSENLLSSSTISRYDITGFYAKFMTHARRPSQIKFIAPGLGLPNDDWLSNLLEVDNGSPRWHLVRHENLVSHDDVEEHDTLGEPLPLFPGPPLVKESENFARAIGI